MADTNFGFEIPLADLIQALTDSINEIRKNTTIYQDTQNILQKYQNIIIHKNFQDIEINELFQMYEEIKKISLELRTILKIKFPMLDAYNSIGYALYYNGRRYYTENLKLEWLAKSSSNTLQLRLDLAIQDISKSYNDEIYNKAQDIFQEHYNAFLNAIQGTYKGTIGRSTINQGHIAEAFEEHLQESHPKVTGFLNRDANVSVLEKMALTQLDESLIKNEEWSPTHEDITSAWIHVRHSLGKQRGTAAGDVGRFQVKETKGYEQANYNKVRLASFTTLRDGINNYSLIFSNRPAQEVAALIAVYLSEPIQKTSEKLLNRITDETVKELLKQFKGSSINVRL